MENKGNRRYLGIFSRFCPCNSNTHEIYTYDGKIVYIDCDVCGKTWNALTYEEIKK